MSSADTRPINPARFAEALKDLSLSSLHLKVYEIRNSIAHLMYSNEELKPFAEGTATAISGQPQGGGPDPDCVEAIRENEVVIERMHERVLLIRAEVEDRGVSWTEFQSKEELEGDQNDNEATSAQVNGDQLTIGGLDGATSTNGTPSVTNNHAASTHTQQPRSEQSHPAWSDGTFQTGTIRNGELRMDASSQPQASGAHSGGRLTDEQLRQAIAAMQTRDSDDEEEASGGMHL
jgi:hypothetical protein